MKNIAFPEVFGQRKIKSTNVHGRILSLKINGD